MATRHIDAGRASALPLNLFAQAIPMLTRNELARLTARLIERLDEQDGDTDTEENDAEDGYIFSRYALERMNDAPGCPVADPGGCEHNGREPEEGF